MFLSVVYVCGMLAGDVQCIYGRPTKAETLQDCQTSAVILAGQIQARALALDFKIGSVYADCPFVDAGAPVVEEPGEPA